MTCFGCAGSLPTELDRSSATDSNVPETQALPSRSLQETWHGADYSFGAESFQVA